MADVEILPRITIGGVTTPFETFATSHARNQPVGTATITMPVPVPVNVVANADVVIEIEEDGVFWDEPIFVGTYRNPDKNLSVDAGATATLQADGDLWRATYRLNKDVVFAGGARTTPQTLTSSAKHIGNDTLSHYATSAPDGTTVSFTVTPLTDSNFVWIAGILHGTNSYPTSLDDKKIRDWSRIEVWQDGVKLGYGNLPESGEQWNEGDQVDWSDRDEWDEYEVYVPLNHPIRTVNGDVTIKFIAGTKPGTSLRDEYEIDDTTWQTAGRVNVRKAIRGLLKRSNVPTYDIFEVTDAHGNVVELGGNGLVDAGQVRILTNEQPITWINRVANLFGFSVFDNPDGKVRGRPRRGAPVGPAQVTFVEGDNIIGIPSVPIDRRQIFNAVKVVGASGRDEDGKKFQYDSETNEGDIIPIPGFPSDFVNTSELSNGMLVSDSLCVDVREIAEVNLTNPETINLDVDPIWLRPNLIIAVESDTLEIDQKYWTDSVKYTYDPEQGLSLAVVGWAGTEAEFAEIEDPDPDEDDFLPTDPRPVNEWQANRPNAGVA